jgi:hypothetical protein
MNFPKKYIVGALISFMKSVEIFDIFQIISYFSQFQILSNIIFNFRGAISVTIMNIDKYVMYTQDESKLNNVKKIYRTKEGGM